MHARKRERERDRERIAYCPLTYETLRLSAKGTEKKTKQLFVQQNSSLVAPESHGRVKPGQQAPGKQPTLGKSRAKDPEHHSERHRM